MFDPCIIKCSTFFKLETAGGRHISFLQLLSNDFRCLINAKRTSLRISPAAADVIRKNDKRLEPGET